MGCWKTQKQPGRKVTHCELVIMSLVARGFSNQAIAEKRHVEPQYPSHILSTLSKVLECERDQVVKRLKEVGALQPNNEINFDYLYPKLEV